MASVLSSPYKDDGIVEIVPDCLKMAGKLAQSSIITDRRRVRIVPQNGQSFQLGAGGSSGVLNFLIQDGQAYADLLSAVVSFDINVWDSGNGALTASTVTPDDGAWSVFRRAFVSVNSTIADDIDLVAKKANAEIYATCPQSWYDSVGSFMGLWKQSSVEALPAAAVIPGGNAPGTQALGNCDNFISKYNILAKQRQFAKIVQTVSKDSNDMAVLGQNHFSFPVSLLTSFFRTEQLFPSRNAGQLYLQLQLAGAIEACVAAAGTAGLGTVVPNVQITNITMEMDYVTLHPSYLDMMDTLMARPDEEGVRWVYDANTVATGLIPAGAGDTSVVFTKASQNLRSIHVVSQPTNGLSAVGYAKQSTFCNPTIKNIQYRAGSLYFPAFQSIGEARMAMDLANSYGSIASVEKSGIYDANNYYLITAATGVTQTSNNNGTAVGTGGTLNTVLADCWLHGYCFDKLKRAKYEGADLDGLNTLSSSGSQIVVQMNCNPADAQTLTGILRYTRVLVLANGSTRIQG